MAVTVGRHNLAYDPVGLWQFNETLNDTSGNGFNLTVEVGTERYTDIYPGVRGVQLIGNKLIYNTFTSTLAITGDVTLEAVLYLATYASANTVLITSHGDAGETQAANYMYFYALNTDSSLSMISENGAGTNATHTITDGPGLGLCHMAVTRASNVIQFYLNGRAYGSPSSTLTTPDGGTTGRFRVGGPDANIFGPEGAMASLKVCNIALSAAQVAAEYNLTVGPVLGFV